MCYCHNKLFSHDLLFQLHLAIYDSYLFTAKSDKRLYKHFHLLLQRITYTALRFEAPSHGRFMLLLPYPLPYVIMDSRSEVIACNL